MPELPPSYPPPPPHAVTSTLAARSIALFILSSSSPAGTKRNEVDRYSACNKKAPHAGLFGDDSFVPLAAAAHDLRLVWVLLRECLPLRTRVIGVTLGFERGGVEAARAELGAGPVLHFVGEL